MIPAYDKLSPGVLARVTIDHEVLADMARPVDFNVFVDEVFLVTAPTFDDWCYLAALAMVAARQSLDAEEPPEPVVEPLPEPVEPPSALQNAKDFLTNLLRPRENPSSSKVVRTDG